MNNFFFSYSSADRAQVSAVRTELEHLGLRVWMDVQQVGPGDSIASRLDDGMGASEHFVLFVSSSWMRSKWTEAEYNAAFYIAMNSGDRKVFLVRLDDVKLQPFLASRRAIAFESALQVANELAGAVRSPQPSEASSWTLMAWSLVDHRYLTALANRIVTGRPPQGLEFPLGAKTLRLDLLKAMLDDQIIVEDLRAELKIYQALQDVIGRFQVMLNEGGLSIFQPGFEIQLERRIVKLDQSRDRIRATLEAMSPRLWIREDQAKAARSPD